MTDIAATTLAASVGLSPTPFRNGIAWTMSALWAIAQSDVAPASSQKDLSRNASAGEKLISLFGSKLVRTS